MEVTAHLEVRGMPGAVPLNTGALTRRAAAEAVRGQIGSTGLAEGAPLHLVAAAWEAAGGGVLVEALREWGARHSCTVWLALPAAQADPAAKAQVAATLLEMEQLRGQGLAFACLLHEQMGTQAELAQRFGDALLHRIRRGAVAFAGYRGFGLGVVRDPALALEQRLAYQVAVRVVEEYLHSPVPAYWLPRLREGLHRPILPLLIPVEGCPVFQERWIDGETGEGALESLLSYYEPHGQWHRRAADFWEQALKEALQGLASTTGYAWRSGFEVVHAEAREALERAHALLETEIARCEQTVAEQQVRFEVARATAQAGEVNPAELDRLVAAYLLESMRLGALERLALAIDGVVELMIDGLQAKAEQVRRLLQAVREQGKPVAAIPLAHALPTVLTAEQEQEWLADLSPRMTQALLQDVAAPAAAEVLTSARRDVDRYIRTRNLTFSLPRGHQLREGWLNETLPRLTLVGGERMVCACEVSPGLPADYREDLAERSALVQERPIEWFPGEWVVHAETPPLAIGQLAGLAGWAASYRATSASARQGMHVLAQPMEAVAAGLDPEIPRNQPG